MSIKEARAPQRGALAGAAATARSIHPLWVCSWSNQRSPRGRQRCLPGLLSFGITPPAYNGHATPKAKVRFRGYYPIKPHDPLLMSRPAKSIPFQSCDHTMEATWSCLRIFLFTKQYLGWGLHEYLIHFDTLTLVVQCQLNYRMKLSSFDVPVNLYKFYLYTDCSSYSPYLTLAGFMAI